MNYLMLSFFLQLAFIHIVILGVEFARTRARFESKARPFDKGKAAIRRAMRSCAKHRELRASKG